jgi:hypothetical protein
MADKTEELNADDRKIAELMASMDPTELQNRIRSVRVSRTRDYFGKHLKETTGEDSVTLSVRDWRSIDLFLMEPQTAEHTPGGEVFEHVLADTRVAIESRDAKTLIGNLLLLYKAIKRG